jgi:hypothetical protein
MHVAAKRRVLMVNATGAQSCDATQVFGPAKARRAELRGDRTSASRVDNSRLPNRHIRRRFRASNFALPGEPGLARPTTLPDAAFRDSRRVRGSMGSGVASASDLRVITPPSEQRLRADLGACRPFFPCGHDDTQREDHASVIAAGSKCIPVSSAASTVTEIVEPSGTAAVCGNEPLIPRSAAQTASSARINTRSRSLIPGV